MKKFYESCEIEIVALASEDVLDKSNPIELEDDIFAIALEKPIFD